MSTAPLPPIDYEGFARDLIALRKEIDSDLGERDRLHTAKMERWGRLCTLFGYATAWMAPNPLSVLLISQGNVARWTIVMHHLSHRALDNVPGAPENRKSKRFAMGMRRYIDWLDWMLPEAWHVEHDLLHHYRTGEPEDPDRVTDSAATIREANLPRWAKYGIVALFMATWKLSYYAPSTFQALQAYRCRRAGETPPAEQHYIDAFNILRPEGRAFWRLCVLPYAFFRFGLMPALFLPLGPAAAGNVLVNSLLAEVLANAHSFLLIVPNHTGADLYTFEGRTTDRAEHFVRQVLSSTNYTCGGDIVDFLQGFLNYQIEHHLFPDLPPLRYREIQPRVKAICEKHGVPYVQENVFRRAKKALDVLVGASSMKVTSTQSKSERAYRGSAPDASA